MTKTNGQDENKGGQTVQTGWYSTGEPILMDWSPEFAGFMQQLEDEAFESFA